MHAGPEEMSNQMWGGRFQSGPDAIMEDINASIEFDKALWRQDIAGSKAHVAMLGKQGIIEAKDAEEISKGLDKVADEIASGAFTFSRALEDIHMNIESRLADLIGPAAGRLHTARSRNDQVATDMRLWVRDTLDALDQRVIELQAFAQTHEQHDAHIATCTRRPVLADDDGLDDLRQTLDLTVDFSRADAGEHTINLGKFMLECSLDMLLHLDRLRQADTRRTYGLKSQIAFVKIGNELTAHASEQQHTEHEIGRAHV